MSQPTPGLPQISAPSPELIEDHIPKVWRLNYNTREGITHIYFSHKGNFRTALKKAQDYCEGKGYRFITIKPFIVDLDYDGQGKGSNSPNMSAMDVVITQSQGTLR